MDKNVKWYEYYNGPDENIFRISASQFSKFMDKPWEWYRQQVLNEDLFQSTTSTILGTIVHGAAERVANNLPFTKEHVEEFLATITDPEIDKSIIREQYPLMAAELINSYVLPNKQSFHEAEPFLTVDLGSDIEVGGSIDRVESCGDGGTYRIIDFKSYHSKTKPKKIPQGYKYQLLIYASVYSKRKQPVSEVRLVYINRHIDGGFSEKTGKPLKSYAPEVTVLTEPVTADDIAYIDSMIDMCKETLLAAETHPELIWLLFRDPRLKD